MNGKDIFLGLKFVGDDLIEKAEYGSFSAKTSSDEKKTAGTRRTLRRSLLIAAVIVAMLLLAGCAVVYMLSMKQMEIGQQQKYRDKFEYDPDTGAAVGYLGQEAVTEQVLTLSGIKGSRNYQAALEWVDFQPAYDPDHQIAIRAQRDGMVPELPEEYSAYNIYTPEMKDKLDEILKK